MRSLPTVLFLALLLIAAPAAADHHAEAPHAPKEDGFEPLIVNGSIDDWTQRGGVARYEVEEGDVLVGTAVPKTPNSFLCPPDDVADFDLRFEFKVDPRLNSGVMFRAQSDPGYRDGRVHGYQSEIDPSDRAWSCGIYDEARRGWINDLADNPAAREAFRPEDWNEVRIRAVGDHIRTWINGVPAAELVDDTDASGFLGFQVHSIKGEADPEPPMQVRWRNLRIKRLDPKRPEPPKTK